MTFEHDRGRRSTRGIVCSNDGSRLGGYKRELISVSNKTQNPPNTLNLLRVGRETESGSLNVILTKDLAIDKSRRGKKILIPVCLCLKSSLAEGSRLGVARRGLRAKD